MINEILIALSILSGVGINAFQNGFGKSNSKNSADINFYNTLMFAVCVLVFGVLAFLSAKISLYTVILGIAFGAFTTFQQYYKVVALANGPMHITVLIITASMLIPTLSGPILFPESEKFSILKLTFAAFLVFFIYLSGKIEESTGDKKKAGGKWLFSVAVAFLCQGLIGVMQKVHQSSEYKDELFAFLAISFVFSFIFSLVKSRGCEIKSSFTRKTYLSAVVCGVFTFAVNFINLKLSGEIPTQIFFPLINGSNIIFTALLAVFFFKEKMSKRQLVGVVGGMLCLIAIVLV